MAFQASKKHGIHEKGPACRDSQGVTTKAAWTLFVMSTVDPGLSSTFRSTCLNVCLIMNCLTASNRLYTVHRFILVGVFSKIAAVAIIWGSNPPILIESTAWLF
jgi:hypothetical protein